MLSMFKSARLSRPTPNEPLTADRSRESWPKALTPLDLNRMLYQEYAIHSLLSSTRYGPFLTQFLKIERVRNRAA